MWLGGHLNENKSKKSEKEAKKKERGTHQRDEELARAPLWGPKRPPRLHGDAKMCSKGASGERI